MNSDTATFALSPETKQAWIDALRSGNYRQGQRSLYVDGYYCCLGVLCRVLGKEDRDIDGWAHPYDVDTDGIIYFDDDDVCVNPEHLTSVMYKGVMTPLSDLNDNKNLSFEEIADLIEKNVPTH